MEYTHQTRIGNEGDLVKHAVLARFVSQILSSTPEQEFVYAETHTGRAEYRLPDDGRWRFGIGKFIEKLLPTAHRSDSNPEEVGVHLLPYVDTCFHGPVQPGYTYPGSSGMVFKMLRKAERGFKFYLWDMDPAVCHSLLGFYENWPEVSICRGDGYHGVSRIGKTSLILVDPISIEEEEQKKIFDLLGIFTETKTPFICWTALVRDQEKSYESFRQIAGESYIVDWVEWEPQGKTSTIGCQVTVPKGRWGMLAQQTISQVRTLMNWT